MNGIAVRAVISGRVQQVGYRMWTVREATVLGLRGWVRNCRNGDVEALFIGPPDLVDAMVEKCRRGPRLAEVSRVERLPAEDDGAAGFEQRETV
jgi:acylphosphatase